MWILWRGYTSANSLQVSQLNGRSLGTSQPITPASWSRRRSLGCDVMTAPPVFPNVLILSICQITLYWIRYEFLASEYFLAMCSQYASILYYAESIKNSSIYGTKCDSWENFEEGNCDGNEKAVFGEYLSPGANGKYYLSYNSSGKTDLNVQQGVEVEQNHSGT